MAEQILSQLVNDETVGERGMKKYSGSLPEDIHLEETGREYLKLMKKKPTLQRAMTMMMLREAIGADAFDSITLDRMYKSLLKGYTEWEPQWPKIVSKRTNVVDFRTRYSIIHSGFNRLPAVGEKEAYPEMEYSDDQISWTPAKYGGLYGISFEASTYDDLGMFDEDMVKLGRAAARTLDYFVFYTCIDANPTSYDGSNNVFTAGTFANAATNAGINNTNLETDYEAMLAQTQLDSSSTFTDENYLPAMYIPKYMIVHPSYSFLAKRVLNSDQIAGSANNDKNMLNGELELLITPFITSTNFYLVADPAIANTFEVGLWNGSAEPELFYEPSNTGHGFAFDEIRSKIRTIFGGGVLDPRAWYKDTAA